jgi:hypothetical protein
MKRLLILGMCLLASVVTLEAQRGRRGGAAPAVSPRQAAPIDLTGYWVSPVIEDWKYRMVVPNKGVFDGIPLNAEGRKVGMAWDPAADETAGEQCRGFGAGAIMRLPGRLHITWQDETTLKVETDTGMQTRLLMFRPGPPGPPSWQGHSAASWNVPARTLNVTTTDLKAGYVRRNGAPYSDRATITEYWEMHTLPNKDEWLTITTKVSDPVYFSRPYLTSSDFKKLPDAAGWNPTPCTAH